MWVLRWNQGVYINNIYEASEMNSSIRISMYESVGV